MLDNDAFAKSGEESPHSKDVDGIAVMDRNPAAPSPSSAPLKRAGRWWIVAAALLWSSGGLFVKAPIFAEWPEAERGPLLAFWRAVFAAAVLVPLVRRPRWRRDLLPLLAAFPLMSVAYLSSMTLTTAANAIWLQSTAPWWVFLFGVLIFREPVDRRNLLPLVFAALGVGLILAFEIRGQAQLGVALGIGSGAAYATVVVFMRGSARKTRCGWSPCATRSSPPCSCLG